MSRPSHWLSLWFFALGLGLWWLGAFERSAAEPEPPKTAVLQHSGRQALEPVVANLKGQVEDRFGWPLAGAEIQGPAGQRAVSDADGRFVLKAGGSGQQQLIAKAAGHGAARARGLSGDPMLIVLGPALPWKVEPEVKAPDEILLAGEGELVDQQGAEVHAGRVLVLATGDAVQADEFGRFRLPLPTGKCRLLAYDALGRVGEIDFEPSRSQGVLPLGRITLHDGFDLAGVLRTSSNDPCTEATLQLEFEGMRRQVLTDAAGRFAFRGLIAGQYALTALPHRGDLGFREDIALDSDQDADWALQPSRSLRIQVLNRQQSPWPGVHVVAEEPGLPAAYARADEEGRAVLDGLGGGPYDFEVRDQDLGELGVIAFDGELGQLVVSDAVIGTKEH